MHYSFIEIEPTDNSDLNVNVNSGYDYTIYSYVVNGKESFACNREATCQIPIDQSNQNVIVTFLPTIKPPKSSEQITESFSISNHHDDTPHVWQLTRLAMTIGEGNNQIYFRLDTGSFATFISRSCLRNLESGSLIPTGIWQSQWSKDTYLYIAQKIGFQDTNKKYHYIENFPIWVIDDERVCPISNDMYSATN